MLLVSNRLKSEDLFSVLLVLNGLGSIRVVDVAKAVLVKTLLGNTSHPCSPIKKRVVLF